MIVRMDFSKMVLPTPLVELVIINVLNVQPLLLFVLLVKEIEFWVQMIVLVL